MEAIIWNLSRDMTKPTKWLCAQRRFRSAWASPSLIRVFAVCMKKAGVLSYPMSAQQRHWSDWADAQADLSLRWAHSHSVGIVKSRLISWIWICRVTLNNSRRLLHGVQDSSRHREQARGRLGEKQSPYRFKLLPIFSWGRSLNV